MTPSSNGTWTESALYQFPPIPNGFGPGELAFDAAGNIFGTTRSGGANGTGIIFNLDRSSGWQESDLLSFDGYPYQSGGSPYGTITFDAAGALYGTTIFGGSHDFGVVYKLTKQGSAWQEKVLYNFAGGADGNVPLGVIFGPDGSLYGITQGGGNQWNVFCLLGCGTVFKLTPNADGTWTKTTLYAFRGAHNDGAIPTTRITFDQAGNIYGTTTAGGSSGRPCYSSGCGTVFKLTPSPGGQWTESILHFFTGGSDGDNPDSPLAIDGAGNLYGTAADGGLYSAGVAYEITP